MLIREYRIPFPATLEEYRIGMLYMISRATEEENRRSKGQKPVHLVTRQRFVDHQRGVSGVYTEKHVHVRNFLPSFIKIFIPEQKCILVERAWNAFPNYCLTTYESPFFAKSFYLSVQSRYVGNDAGGLENALGLSPSELQQRQVVHVNLGSEEHVKMTSDTDVVRFESKQAGRGELDATGQWMQRDTPIMCCYKLVRLNVSIPSLPSARVEEWCHRHALLRAFVHYNRQALCWMDQWYGLDASSVYELHEPTCATAVPLPPPPISALATDLAADGRALADALALTFAAADDTNPFVT
ncbi:unnamed protein product [Agarophyton chilense]